MAQATAVLSDERIMTDAVGMILPEIIEWLGDRYTGQDKQIVDSIVSVIPLNDGYRAARYLENIGWWEADEQLVDILAMLPTAVKTAEKRAIRADA